MGFKKKEEILRYLKMLRWHRAQRLYTAAEGIKVMLKMRNVYFIFFYFKENVMELRDIFEEKCWFTKTDLNTFGCLEYVYIVQW